MGSLSCWLLSCGCELTAEDMDIMYIYSLAGDFTDY